MSEQHFSDWMSIYQFVGDDIPKARKLAIFMRSLGITGDLFHIDFLLDIQQEMEQHDNACWQ